MIGIVVDSNSQMPASVAQRFGIAVVPITVTIDGREYLEGVDLDADAFYAAWTDGRAPEISTSQPAPGLFVDAYRRLVAAGATEILSIHVTASLSGTINSARIATTHVDVPVRLVDTRTASFGISCCAWAGAEAIESGADIETAALMAERRADRLRTSFVVGVPELAERSGRADGVDLTDRADDGLPILAMSGDDLSVLTTVGDLDGAVSAMADDALAWPPSGPSGLRVAIGTSDSTSAPVATGLTERLADEPAVAEIVHYRIGPSVGAHTGPGTAGLFVF